MKPILPTLIVLALLSACGTARRGEPVAGPLALDDNLRRGQQAYAFHCDKCHPGGEAGLGPGINDKPLPRFLIKFQVRNGLGAMPSFDERQIPPDELDRLVDYLKALRGKPVGT